MPDACVWGFASVRANGPATENKRSYVQEKNLYASGTLASMEASGTGVLSPPLGRFPTPATVRVAMLDPDCSAHDKRAQPGLI